MEKLDFLETEARSNAAFHIACADALENQGHTFLILVLAGAGAALGYAINLFEKSAQRWLVYGLVAVTVYLFVIAAIVTIKCLWARPMYPPANEPQNLDQESHDLDAIRRVDISNRQHCIDLNRDRNDVVGLWLNRCRLLAVATPIVFVAVALAAAVR